MMRLKLLLPFAVMLLPAVVHGLTWEEVVTPDFVRSNSNIAVNVTSEDGDAICFSVILSRKNHLYVTVCTKIA